MMPTRFVITPTFATIVALAHGDRQTALGVLVFTSVIGLLAFAAYAAPALNISTTGQIAAGLACISLVATRLSNAIVYLNHDASPTVSSWWFVMLNFLFAAAVWGFVLAVIRASRHPHR